MKKILFAFACGLLAASLLSAKPASAILPPDAKAAPDAKQPDPKAAAVAKPGAAKPGSPLTVKEEEPVIPGTSVKRENGTWIGLEVVGGNFKLSFYDKKKKSMAPDITRASARWPNPRAPGDNRTMLNASGNVLVGAKPVLPPFTFNVYLTFLQGEGDEAKAVESYVIPFRG
jgi:hypothetical protein